jgi:hypothetical protein
MSSASVLSFLPACDCPTNNSLSLNLMLRPTVSRPVCLWIKHPSGAYDQVLIIVWQLRVCFCGALSLTSGRVCRSHLLLDLASAVNLGSEFLGPRDHLLLSQIRDFPSRCLLRLAGSRVVPLITSRHVPHRKRRFSVAVSIAAFASVGKLMW